MREPVFYVDVGASDSVATLLDPENDLVDVLDTWLSGTEANPQVNHDILIAPGQYPQSVIIDEDTTLIRWGTGDVILGR